MTIEHYKKLSQIEILKSKLKSTDYQAIKYAEGEITESDYTVIRMARAEWRKQINKLEEELK